jgi:hypothetical protein
MHLQFLAQAWVFFFSNPMLLQLVVACAMAANVRKRLLPSQARELQRLTRDEIVSLSALISEHREDFSDRVSPRAWGADFHANFDAISCEDRFPYAGKDGEFVHEYLDPSLLVQLVLSRSPRLARRWVVALQKWPNSIDRPWHCVVGFDEYQPGDKFSFEKAKAVMCLYFNFAEVDVVSQGSTWFCPVTVRMKEIDSTVGGWSRALACILHRMFLGDHGAQTVGIAFSDHNNRDCIVYAKLSHLVSDGDGHRKATGWRGANSLRPSIIHGNILKKDSDLSTRAPGFVEISCTDKALLRRTTAAEFQDSADFVAEASKRYKQVNPHG